MDGPRCYRGVGEALCIVWLLCSNALTVRSYRVGPASTNCAFLEASLVVKASGLRGRQVVLGALEPLEPVEGFVPLCHTLCVTLSEEWGIALCPLSGVEEPLSLGHSEC
jgi:hypothetical protein